jgi:hypothetical protein
MPRLDSGRVSLGILLYLLATTASVAEGQGIDAIPPQARVRVDFPAADPSRFERSRFGRPRPQSVVGALEAVRADTLLLVVRSSTEPLRVPRAAIRAMYLSAGRPPRWQAALQGALLPALVGATLSAAGTSIHRKAGDPTPTQAAVSSAMWAGGSGAVLGAWHPPERWRRAVIGPSSQR